MNVWDFLSGIKAQTQYGDPTVQVETPTTNLLAALNLKAGRVWSKWDWPWSLEELTFAITTSARRFLVASKSGNKVSRITDLVPQDASVTPPLWGRPLVQVSRREFYSKYSQAIAYSPATGQILTQSPGMPIHYINLGLDPAGSGAWVIEIAPLSNQAFTMAGWAKARRVPYTMADVLANNPMTFFPDDIVDDLINDGVLSIAYRYAGKPDEADKREIMFDRALNDKVQEQIAAAEDNTPITSPPNPAYQRRQWGRSWGGTRVE